MLMLQGMEKAVSVSLRSIVHSYKGMVCGTPFLVHLFPSPYGVSFILIRLQIKVQ